MRCEYHCGVRSARQVYIWRSVWRGRMQGDHLLMVNLAEGSASMKSKAFVCLLLAALLQLSALAVNDGPDSLPKE